MPDADQVQGASRMSALRFVESLVGILSDVCLLAVHVDYRKPAKVFLFKFFLVFAGVYPFGLARDRIQADQFSLLCSCSIPPGTAT